MERWKASIATGEPFDMTFPLRGADGQFRRFLTRIQPLKDAQGRVVRWFGTNTDVEEMKRAEETLSRSQKTFSELVDRSPFGTYIVDSQFRIAQMNAGSQTGAFQNVRPVIGRDFTEAMRILWPETVAAEIISHFRHTLDTGEPYYSPRFMHSRQDVEVVEAYEWELHRMTLPDGQYGVICYYYDSTKLRTAEAALRQSEERYRSLFDELLEGFCIIEVLFDADNRPIDFRYLETNPAFDGQTGWSDAKGKRVRELAPDLEAHWFDIYGKVALTGEPARFVDEVRPLNRWYDVSAYRVGGPDSRKVAVRFNDITDRKQAEDALKFLVECGTDPNKDFFQELARYLATRLGMDFVCIDTLQEGLLAAQTLAMYYNGKFEDNVSYTLKDTPCGDVVGKAICCFPEGVRHLFPKDVVLQEMLAESYVGTTLWSSQGQPIGLIAVIGRKPLADTRLATSILQLVAVRAAGEVERRKAEEDLKAAKISAEQAREAAEHASKAKDHFIAVLSHELRNPLNPVLATASMLREDPRFDADIREQLEIICRNAELEARLIDDLLDVTRIERGKVALDRRPIELVTIIRRTVEVCLPDIEARKLEFGVDAPDGPYPLYADAARMQQVFWNLLKNAIKFTPVGGCVGFRCRRDDDGFVVVQVNDSGEGIEPAALSRLFNAFEQVERSITRQFGGLGLGLTISKAMVELHGGSIHVHSEGKGKGATFTVRLPLMVGEADLQPDTPPSQVRPQAAPRPLRVLLVEDHGDTARIMRRLLSADGHEVQTAADVSTALQLAAQHTFDVLLSDLGLPDGSGLELMRTLRQRGLLLQGIALSGYGQERDVQQSRDAGFADHLTKPVSVARLKEAIAKVTSEATQVAAGVMGG